MGKSEKPILCRIGLHRPLYGHWHAFVDSVSGGTVYNAKCPCGKLWLTDSPFGWGFRADPSETLEAQDD